MVPFTIAILRHAVDVDGGAAGEPEEIAPGRPRCYRSLALAWMSMRGCRRLPTRTGAGWLTGLRARVACLSFLIGAIGVDLLHDRCPAAAVDRRRRPDRPRTIRNLMAGNGPVFNAGERVEAKHVDGLDLCVVVLLLDHRRPTPIRGAGRR